MRSPKSDKLSNNSNYKMRKKFNLFVLTLAIAPNQMAERVGFEPTVRFPAHSISSAANSTTLAPLRTKTNKDNRKGSCITLPAFLTPAFEASLPALPCAVERKNCRNLKHGQPSKHSVSSSELSSRSRPVNANCSMASFLIHLVSNAPE